jgi:hypothetical protein
MVIPIIQPWQNLVLYYVKVIIEENDICFYFFNFIVLILTIVLKFSSVFGTGIRLVLKKKYEKKKLRVIWLT